MALCMPLVSQGGRLQVHPAEKIDLQQELRDSKQDGDSASARSLLHKGTLSSQLESKPKHRPLSARNTSAFDAVNASQTVPLEAKHQNCVSLAMCVPMVTQGATLQVFPDEEADRGQADARWKHEEVSVARVALVDKADVSHSSPLPRKHLQWTSLGMCIPTVQQEDSFQDFPAEWKVPHQNDAKEKDEEVPLRTSNVSSEMAEISRGPDFPDYSALFDKAIAERRNGARGITVPYNFVQRQEEGLGESQDSDMDEPFLHPDYAALFAMALARKREGRGALVVKYGKVPDSSSTKPAPTSTPEQRKRGVWARLTANAKKKLVCGAASPDPDQ